MFMKYSIIFFFISFLGQLAFAQDTTYLDKSWDETTITEDWKHQKITTIEGLFKKESVFNKTGNLTSEVDYIGHENISVYAEKPISYRRNGSSKAWYDIGQLKETARYDEGKLDQERWMYWQNGQVKRHEFWDKGAFLKGKCFNEDGEEIEFFDYEIQPEFPGGMTELFKYLGRNIEYPRDAQERGVTGRVVARFTIQIDGTIAKIEIVKSLYPSIDEETIRVIKAMPLWQPGQKDGKLVNVYYTLPVRFNLDRGGISRTKNKKRKKS